MRKYRVWVKVEGTVEAMTVGDAIFTMAEAVRNGIGPDMQPRAHGEEIVDANAILINTRKSSGTT